MSFIACWKDLFKGNVRKITFNYYHNIDGKMIFSFSDKGIPRKGNPSSPNRSLICGLPFPRSDALHVTTELQETHGS